MPRRPALVTQADIARAIRALKAAGHPDVRIVFDHGRLVVEPGRPDDDRRERANDDGEELAVL